MTDTPTLLRNDAILHDIAWMYGKETFTAGYSAHTSHGEIIVAVTPDGRAEGLIFRDMTTLRGSVTSRQIQGLIEQASWMEKTFDPTAESITVVIEIRPRFS
jgi:hypothetical protein